MPQYTFKINDEYRTAEAFDLDEALRKAGIDENDGYEIVEGDDFENSCLKSVIVDELF